MSAAVRRKSVCGPGCPEIVAVDNGIALSAVRRGPLSVAARKPATTVIGESAQGLFGLHGPPFRPGDLGLAHVVRCLWLAARKTLIIRVRRRQVSAGNNNGSKIVDG